MNEQAMNTILASIKLEDYEPNSPQFRCVDAISELYANFSPSVDLVEYSSLVEKAEKKDFDDFYDEAQKYLNSIQSKFKSIVHNDDEVLNFTFGLPFNPISKSIFSKSALCHLMTEQQFQKYQDSRWVLESELYPYNLSLKKGTEPTCILVQCRSDLFKKAHYQHSAFYLKVYNASQIENFPPSINLEIDFNNVESILDSIVSDYAIRTTTTGPNVTFRSKDDDSEKVTTESADNDVLLASKHNTKNPQHILQYNSEWTQTKIGAQLVALAEVSLLCSGFYDKYPQMKGNHIANLMAHAVSKSLLTLTSPYQDTSTSKVYEGSLFLKHTFCENEELLENCLPDLLDATALFFEELRKNHSNIPFAVHQFINNSIPKNDEVSKALQASLVKILSSGQLDDLFKSVNVDTKRPETFFQRFLSLLEKRFEKEPGLFHDLVDGKETLIEAIFNEFMDQQAQISPGKTKESYFNLVSSNIATGLANRLNFVSKYEKDWLNEVIQVQKRLQEMEGDKNSRNRYMDRVLKIKQEVETLLAEVLLDKNFNDAQYKEKYDKLVELIHSDV